MRRRDLLLLCLLPALFLGTGCGRVDEAPVPVAADEDAPPPPDSELFDSTVTDTRDGARRWILRSQRMERWLDVEDAELYDVHMDFYKADTLHSTLTSERGRANLRTKDLKAWGNVVVLTRDGRRLETEELDYENATGLITNEVFNRFTRSSGDVMTGTGMIATPDLDSFELKRDVEAEVHGEMRGRSR